MSQRSVHVLAAVVCLTFGTVAVAGDAPRRSTAADNVALDKGACFCGSDTGGDAFCFIDEFCDDLDPCNSNADCAAGYKCLTDNCCDPPKDQGVCSPICGDGECTNPGTCATYETCEPPLFVELESFVAEFRGGVVVLTWTTTSEVDNIGFRLLRARTANGLRQDKDAARAAAVQLDLVTPRLIPAEGTALSGASYEYRDANLVEPGRVFYYLEDMDTTGKATLHGPVEVVIPAPARTAR